MENGAACLNIHQEPHKLSSSSSPSSFLEYGSETPEISILDSETALVVGLRQRADLMCRIFPPVDVNVSLSLSLSCLPPSLAANSSLGVFQDVVWQLDTNVISSSDGRRRTVQRSHPELTCITTLHVDNTTAQDEGTYECHAEGSTGDQHAQRLLLLAGELHTTFVTTSRTLICL